VRLPRLLLSAAGAHPAADGTGQAGEGLSSIAGLRVLVVEDEPDTQNVLCTVLVAAGAQVRAASSSREALEALGPFAPDVIVSDLEMPGEDGLSLIRKVRARARHEGGSTPAAGLTAYASNEDRTRPTGVPGVKEAPEGDLVPPPGEHGGRRL
jgi:CheY-like chemotaxis protein